MKRIYIIIFMALGVKTLSAQSDSTFLQMYPLQTGNYWEYEEILEDFIWDTVEYSYYSLEVIGDTLMPNQKRYQILRKRELPEIHPDYFVYDRIDSISYNIYRYDSHVPNSHELLIDSLRLIISGGEFTGGSRLNSTFPATIIYMDSTEELVFNSPAKLYHFFVSDWIVTFGYDYWFAKGLGIVRYIPKESFMRNSITLIYAIINGKPYGYPVSVKKASTNCKSFLLHQNFPNPFNPSTTIEYELPADGKVEFNLYNILGQKIKTLVKEFQTPGVHKIELAAQDLSSGIYIYEIKFGNFIERKKLLVQK